MYMKYPKDKSSGDDWDDLYDATRGTEIDYEEDEDVDEVDFDTMEDEDLE